MPFGFLRLLDRLLGTALYFVVAPLCNLIQRFLPSAVGTTPSTISILKLHGGGSLLMAMPALLGIRRKYPHAIITLIGTPETHKFADLTGVFNNYIMVDSHSLPSLVKSGVAALTASFRQDIFIDLEPHSALASLFTPLTFSKLRIGFVKSGEFRRAQSYTHPIYFNLHAPIYIFYEQAAGMIGAEPASTADCKNMMESLCNNLAPTLTASHPRPAIYASAFTSSLSPERMMPTELWLAHFAKRFGTAKPFTVILGGGAVELDDSNELAAKIKAAFPIATILITCGKRTLREAAADIASVDEFWGVDSGPLHIARILGKNATSFWGPSNPAYRLRPIEGLQETVFYRALPCSPCVHMAATSPCHGDNQCMKKIFSTDAPQPITRF